MAGTGAPIVVLIGPPAAGKSRIGRRVARELQQPFIDTDSQIVAEHGPIAEIFRTRGEAAFRAIERDVVSRALADDGVVSLGGGAVLDERTQRELQSQRVALLTVSEAAVARRIGGDKRPLLAGGNPDDRVAAWRTLVADRRDVYERLARRTWDTSARPITTIAREIADWARNDTAGTE